MPKSRITVSLRGFTYPWGNRLEGTISSRTRNCRANLRMLDHRKDQGGAAMAFNWHNFSFECGEPPEKGCEFSQGNTVSVYAVTLLFFTVVYAIWELDNCDDWKLLGDWGIGIGLSRVTFTVQ